MWEKGGIIYALYRSIWESKLRSCRRRAGGKQVSTGHLHWMVRISHQIMKTERAEALSVFMEKVVLMDTICDSGHGAVTVLQIL